jgi:hypothetical protein
MCLVGNEKKHSDEIGLAINCGSKEHQSQHGHSKQCKWCIQQILQTRIKEWNMYGGPLYPSHQHPLSAHTGHI